MIIRFTRGGKHDLLESLRFIDAQGPRRGQKFRAEFRKCLSDIKSSPESWPRVYREVRIRIMKTFQHGIYYEYFKVDGSVWVGTIMHLKRKASSWKKRFKKPRK